MTALPDQDQAGKVIAAALAAVTADQAVVQLSCHQSATTRVANNAITQNLERRGSSLVVHVACGKQHAQASTDDLSTDGIADCVQRAELLARVAAADPEYLPPPAPQPLPPFSGFAADTAAVTPQQRAELVRDAVRICADQGALMAGAVTTSTRCTAVGNSQGLFSCFHSTHARFECSAMYGEPTGFAAARHESFARLDPAAVARRAVAKAQAAREPGTMPPQACRTVLEPEAVAGLLAMLPQFLNRREADEGTIWAKGKLGTRVAPGEITLETVVGQADLPCPPCDSQGLPYRTIPWLQQGTLANLVTSRFWAQRHSLAWVPAPANFLLHGGTGTSDDLVGKVEHGVLVTRLWYIRSVDPMQPLVTGMTRSGLYEIRDGRIFRALTNFRFNENPLRVLAACEARSACSRADQSDLLMLVPALLVSSFNFTSGTKF